MPLARTPPQRVQPLPQQSDAQHASGNTSLRSPSTAFRPMNPKVVRTPPGGHAAVPQPDVPDMMDVDEPGEAPTTAGDNKDQDQDQDQEIEVEELVVAAAGPSSPVRPIRPAQVTPERAPMLSSSTSRPPPSSSQPAPRQPQLGNRALASSQMRTPAPAQTLQPPPQQAESSTTTTTGAITQLSSIPPPPTTPARTRTPRRPSVPPPEQPVPEPIADPRADRMGWGRRYEMTMDTLELAVRAGAGRWTKKDLEQCFPTLARDHPEKLEQVHQSTQRTMSQAILNHANALFTHYKLAPALQLLDEVVKDGKDWTAVHGEGEGRRDAWRPDLTPYALSAATNLPMYDEAWSRLRDEYLGLNQDIRERLKAVRQKEEMLRQVEGQVSDGVVELEKTIQLLQGFPTEEMLTWTEDVAGRLQGARGP